MSQGAKDKNGYINIVADLIFLQNIVCCNQDMNKSSADTPRHSPQNIINLEREDSKDSLVIEPTE